MNRKQIIELARTGVWHNINKISEMKKKYGNENHLKEQLEEQKQFLNDLSELQRNEQLTFGIDFL